MIPEKTHRIEFGTPEMFRAWVDGVECYDATFNGRLIAQEGGVTGDSIEAIQKIIKRTGRTPDSIIIGPCGGCLFSFGELGCYHATGFNPGFRGEGGCGLYEIAAECGFGTEAQCREVAFAWPADKQGVIFAKRAEYGRVLESETATA
jgi:hypothetical protein